MRGRTRLLPLPTLAVAVLALGLATSTATALPAADSADARVRLTGELLTTPAEPGQPVHAAVAVDGRLVPVDAAGVAAVAPGRTVTVDVAVPASVRSAAAKGGTLRVRDGRGRPQAHPLTPRDLAAATAAPAGASSPIADASIATALSPDGGALTVERVVSSRAAASAYYPAVRKVTAVNVTPAGMTPAPATATQIQSSVTGLNTFWRANSRNELGATLAKTAPAFTSTLTCANPFALWEDAASRVGFTYGTADETLALYLPVGNRSCSHGLGTLGQDPNSGGYVYLSMPGVDVLAHEVGHNMSLRHSDRLICPSGADAALGSSGTSWGSSCVEDPYGDGQDIMSIDLADEVSPMLSSPQALRTGMLEPSAAVSVGKGSTSVTLRPLAGRTGTRVATVTNARTGVTYYVEYRTKAGLDATNAWWQTSGVRVLRVNTNAYQGETVLLDPTPGDADPWLADPALKVGSTLTSYDGAVRFTTVSADATQAVVRIDNDTQLGTFTRTADPRVSGTRGVGRTLTASPGTWSPTPTSYTYQWKRNGTRISGATGSSYTPTVADAGRYLSVTVTVHRAGYTSASKTSARVGIPMHATTKPSITGTPRVGRSLYAKVGVWTPIPGSYAYQWYRGSTAITGATARTYTLTRADAGSRVRVKVTARRTGYATGSAYSPYTPTITR